MSAWKFLFIKFCHYIPLIYIDQSDFSEDTSLSRKKFKRLVLGEYVRLREFFGKLYGNVEAITGSTTLNNVRVTGELNIETEIQGALRGSVVSHQE